MFFFIMSGFFLARQNQDADISVTVKKKICHLYPVFVFSLLCCAFFGLDPQKAQAVLANLLFLDSGSGFVKFDSPNPVGWYVCVLFWLSIFFLLLWKSLPPRSITLCMGLICAVSWILMNRLPPEAVNYNSPIFVLLTPGLVNALFSMSFGYFLSQLPKPSFSQARLSVFIRYAIMVVLLFLLCHHMAFRKPRYGTIMYLFWFVPLFWFCLCDQGAKLFSVLGRYSYSIFMMQWAAFGLCRRTLWLHEDFVKENPVLTVALSIIYCVALGVAAYHLVERPGAAFLKKKLLG